MYFWQTKQLEADFINGSLSQNERYRYLLTFMIITASCMELSSYISELPSFIRIIETSSVILATIFGTMFCYNTNKEGDNVDFIDRYICLFLPLFIRLMVLLIILMTIYFTIGSVLYGDVFDEYLDSTNWVDVGFIIAFELLFYWKLSTSIRNVATANTVS